MPTTTTAPRGDAHEHGGVEDGDQVKKKRPKGNAKPLLRSFTVGPALSFHEGRSVRIRFRIKDRSRRVRVWLEVRSRHGKRLRRIDLGDRRTNRPQRVKLAARGFPEGRLMLTIGARDGRGRSLRRSKRASKQAGIEIRAHRFPIDGPFSYSGDGGRFGDPRPGRTHNGQDLPAAEGTPIVAPRGGTVKHVAYQAEGAGNYVVLEGAGEKRTYVFMHLVTGSTRVRAGERVRTGDRIGDVGNTGRSFGAHLHFEIWVGGWIGRGHPVDPLPYLRRWDSWS